MIDVHDGRADRQLGQITNDGIGIARGAATGVAVPSARVRRTIRAPVSTVSAGLVSAKTLLHLCNGDGEFRFARLGIVEKCGPSPPRCAV